MKIVGHRGASNITPENTVVAVKRAFELGADSVEIDIHPTKDNKLVVIHDDTLLRTAGVDINIYDSIYDDIKGYEVGSWFGEQFRGEKLPLLSDVLNVLPAGKQLIIEIKRSIKPEVLVGELKRFGSDMSRYIIISFFLDILQSVKAVEESLTVLFIPEEYSADVDSLPSLAKFREMFAVSDISVDGLAFDSRLKVSEGELDDLRKLGLNIFYCWVVDSLDKAEAMKSLGLDGIETNNLELIMQGRRL